MMGENKNERDRWIDQNRDRQTKKETERERDNTR